MLLMMANIKNIRPFHLAFPVSDLEITSKWYTDKLGCSIGRKSNEWVDFNLFGHQVVAHLSNEINLVQTNKVDNKNIPIRHFGVILTSNEWNRLIKELKKENIEFLIKPHTRFKGMEGEQRTFFIKDPDSNALEFKTFKNDEMIFDN